MNERPFLSHFSPQWTDPEHLEAILVQREDLLAESVDLMRSSVLTDRKHHLLFIGPRGAGKTHLITLIQHRLAQDPDLSDRVRFAWLNEDVTATSFLNLLVHLYESLSARYPDEFPADTISSVRGRPPDEARDLLGQALLRDRCGRTVICLMENLDSVFRSLNVAEQRNWRAFLQNNPVFATVGTAQALFDGIADHDEPFFGFFDVRHLQPLSAEEAASLLEKIATLHERQDLVDFLHTPIGRARVQAIRALAGGNPRLYLIFSDLLVSAAALDDLVRPFEELVDRQLTSYYQERLRWLSPQQREIVQFLSRARGSIAVRFIAEGLFTTTNSITGQLKQLREMRYVDSHPLGREVLYELAEPLMRLALQVKETHDRRPLALIVDFLRVWHEREEIEERLAACGPGSPGRAYFEAAHHLLLTAPNLRHELLRRDLESADPETCADATLNNARCLAEESNLPADWLRVGRILRARKQWDEAINAFTIVSETESSSPTEVAEALRQRGLVYGDAGHPDLEVSDYTRSIDLLGAPPSQVARALVNRGFAHAHAGRADHAITDYTRAIELPDAPVEYVALAFVNRGFTHGQAGRTGHAIVDFTRAIELPDAPAEEVACALNNRGITHGQVGRTDNEMADYTRAIELPGTPSEQFAWALNNRGLTHAEAGRTDDAIADYTRIIELPGAPAEEVAKALNHRGVTHWQAGRTDDAIADYTRAIELPGAPAQQVASALNNRAACFSTSKQPQATIHDLLRLLDFADIPAATGVIADRIHHKAREAVDAVFQHTSDASQWTSLLTEFAAGFARFDGLAQLGEAAVKHLPELADSPLNDAAREAWVDAWDAARATLPAAERDQWEIPLRLLRAGVAWLKTKDERELLALPLEERRVLREALHLPAESSK